ncbi:MAG: hypothetical protein M3N59_00075, partial [bacterium]|nr:hypothetical protein [bacterium]
FFCYEYEASPVFAYETSAPFGSKQCTKQVESVGPEEAYSSPTIGDIWIALSQSKRCKRIHFVYVLR